MIEALGDARVASGVVAFSWRERRESTFNLTYAPLFTSLMARYPSSAEPFLRDLSGQTPALSEQEAETVCRILLDMPEIGTWKQSAVQILPLYRDVTKSLLERDRHASDQEKVFRAEMWMAELKLEPPPVAPQPQSRRRTLPPVPAADAELETLPSLDAPRRIHVDGPPTQLETESRPASSTLRTAAIAPPPSAYDGPKSGTYESSGNPIPQNAEYVFRNLPLVKMRLDYDTRIWEARLMPAEGKTQRLVVKNKSANPQKRCIVHWSVIPE